MYIPSIMVDQVGLQAELGHGKVGHLRVGMGVKKAAEQFRKLGTANPVLQDLKIPREMPLWSPHRKARQADISTAVHAFTHTAKGHTYCMCYFHPVSVHLSSLEGTICIQCGSSQSLSHTTVLLGNSLTVRVVFHQKCLNPVKLTTSAKPHTNSHKSFLCALPLCSHAQHPWEEKVQVEFWL